MISHIKNTSYASYCANINRYQKRVTGSDQWPPSTNNNWQRSLTAINMKAYDINVMIPTIVSSHVV